MKESYFDTQGLYYRTNEWVSGRPFVIFMHGLSGSSSAWLLHEQLFAQTHNTLSFDLRGHGKSKKYKERSEYTIPKFSSDLLALVDHLKIERFVLITHSFGVLIALEFLKQHQDRVHAAILMSPTWDVSNNRRARMVRPFFAGTRLFSIIPFNEQSGSHVNYDHHRGARDWDISMTCADVRNTGLRIYLYASQEAFNVDYEDLLPKLMIPVLLIHGKEDSIFPFHNAEYMKEHIPHAELAPVEGADHIIVVNHFDKIAPLLVGFIARTTE